MAQKRVVSATTKAASLAERAPSTARRVTTVPAMGEVSVK